MNSGPPIWRASLLSLAIAALLVVTTVLPAEFDIDPLGVGGLLGIRGLSVEREEDLHLQTGSMQEDSRTFSLAPFESVEYKYRLEHDAAVVYEWTATAEVVHDFHSEPDGAGEEFAVSFTTGRGTASAGAFVAPFAGIHGWFWENRSGAEVKVTLKASGYFTLSKFYTGGQVFDTKFE
tara:strand:- start:15 stop:548 length:534 start_codon:yes stop_codon:yes gene_type:complete